MRDLRFDNVLFRAGLILLQSDCLAGILFLRKSLMFSQLSKIYPIHPESMLKKNQKIAVLPFYGKTAIVLATGTLLATSFAHSASAAVLTFDITGINNGDSLNSPPFAGYGDRITGFTNGIFSYGSAGGLTPNVVVDYPNNRTLWWLSEYGNLTNVIYAEESGTSILDVTLTADPGFEVVLDSFDLAGWRGDYTINSVQVLSGGTSVFSQSNVFISGTTRTSFNTSNLGSLAASSLTIRFDATNLGNNSDNIGLDNIQFSQRSTSFSPVGTSEPSALVAIGAVAGIATFLKRARKDR